MTGSVIKMGFEGLALKVAGDGPRNYLLDLCDRGSKRDEYEYQHTIELLPCFPGL